MTVFAFKMPARKHPPASELRRKYRAESHIKVTVGSSGLTRLDGSFAPDNLDIEFSGPIALIPSLKNSPMVTNRGGRPLHFMNPETTARLMVMTDLWMAATNGRKISYMRDQLFCLVILAKRPRIFDEDNGFAAVKDWMEPIGKTKNRRWGAGLVDNDYQVSGLALHSWKLGAESDVTRIIIRPLELVREPLLTFVARAMI